MVWAVVPVDRPYSERLSQPEVAAAGEVALLVAQMSAVVEVVAHLVLSSRSMSTYRPRPLYLL